MVNRANTEMTPVRAAALPTGLRIATVQTAAIAIVRIMDVLEEAATTIKAVRALIKMTVDTGMTTAIVPPDALKAKTTTGAITIATDLEIVLF